MMNTMVKVGNSVMKVSVGHDDYVTVTWNGTTSYRHIDDMRHMTLVEIFDDIRLTDLMIEDHYQYLVRMNEIES